MRMQHFENLNRLDRTGETFDTSTIIEMNQNWNGPTMPPSAISPSDAALAFAALGSEQRLGVLRSLVRAGPEGLPMGALSDRMGIAPSTLTHHIQALTSAGLVEQTRQGRQMICAAAAFDLVQQLSSYLLAECCADATEPKARHEAHS